MAGEPGVASFGISIGYLKTPPSTFEDFPRVTSIKKPGRSIETIDATHHKSLGKEYLASPIEDFGEVTVNFNWMPADEVLIDSLVKVTKKYQITLPDGSKIAFDGILTGYEPADSTVEGKEEASLTIKVTGKPTFTAAP